MYCKRDFQTNWTSLSEAKQKCSEDPSCDRFYDNCGHGDEFFYCGDGDGDGSGGTWIDRLGHSGCGSILYSPGKCLRVHIFV